MTENEIISELFTLREQWVKDKRTFQQAKPDWPMTAAERTVETGVKQIASQVYDNCITDIDNLIAKSVKL